MMNSVKGEMNVAAVSVSSVQKFWLPWSWQEFASCDHTQLSLLKCNALHCFLAGINGGKWPHSSKALLSRACPAPCFTPPRATLTIYFLDFVSIPGAYKSNRVAGRSASTSNTSAIESVIQISSFFHMFIGRQKARKSCLNTASTLLSSVHNSSCTASLYSSLQHHHFFLSMLFLNERTSTLDNFSMQLITYHKGQLTTWSSGAYCFKTVKTAALPLIT